MDAASLCGSRAFHDSPQFTVLRGLAPCRSLLTGVNLNRIRADPKKGSGTVVRSTLRAVPATVPDPFFGSALRECAKYRFVPPGASYDRSHTADSRRPPMARGKTGWPRVSAQSAAEGEARFRCRGRHASDRGHPGRLAFLAYARASADAGYPVGQRLCRAVHPVSRTRILGSAGNSWQRVVSQDHPTSRRRPAASHAARRTHRSQGSSRERAGRRLFERQCLPGKKR